MWHPIFKAALAAILLGNTVLTGPYNKGQDNMKAKKSGKVQRSAVKHAAVKHSPGVQTGRSPHAAAGRAAAPVELPVDELIVRTKSVSLSREGDADAASGDWQQAAAHYQEALDVWADNSLAFYGLGQCADARGDVAGAVTYYRSVIYSSDPMYARYGGYRVADSNRLMEYALLLTKANQMDEALRVYNRAADLMDFEPMNGHQRKKVLLPALGDGPGQVPYTPERLEAMTHLAVGLGLFPSSSGPKIVELFQQAIKLAPDSAIPYFYLGKYLYGINNKGAKAALERAVALGDAATGAAAQEYLDLIH